MDLEFTTEQEAFRAELRSWLDAHLPGEPPRDLADRFAFLRSWQRALHQGRWAAPHWPSAYGGRDAGVAEQVIYHEGLARRRAPATPASIGINLCGLELDMHSPGVEVRPIRQITGESEFCEVLLSDVEIPLGNLVGALHGGAGPSPTQPWGLEEVHQ